MFMVATMVLCVFLLSQGHSLHTDYWQQLRDRAQREPAHQRIASGESGGGIGQHGKKPVSCQHEP